MLNFIYSCLQTSDALDMEDINYVALLVKIRLKSGTDLAIKDASGELNTSKHNRLMIHCRK